MKPTEPTEAVEATLIDPLPSSRSDRTGWAVRPTQGERDTYRGEVAESLAAAISGTAPTSNPKGTTLRPSQVEASDSNPTFVLGASDANGGFTDHANALRFVDDHIRYLRYRTERGYWMGWRDDRWRRLDKTAITQYARVTADKIGAEHADGNADIRRKAAGVASRASLSAMIELAAGDDRIRADETQWNFDPWLLNVKNGTIDLEHGSLHSQSPNNFIDRIAPTTYNPSEPRGSAHDRWTTFLDQMFQGDEDLIAYVQRFIGYAITGVVREHALFVLYGPGGNGKSVFLNTVMSVLGKEYAIQLDSDLLLAKGQSADSNYGLADLEGMRFAVASEINEGARFSEALVKQITGGDRIRARRIREAPFEFTPTAKIVIATNHPPVVSSTDDGIWRRLKLVPAPGRVARPDPALPAKLLQHPTVILNWMIEGCIEWQRVGLGTCDAVEVATADYRASMDVLGTFLGEKCDIDISGRVGTTDLYKAYSSWAVEAGVRPWTHNNLSRKLGARGFEPGKSSDGRQRVWKGLSLRSFPAHHDDGPF